MGKRSRGCLIGLLCAVSVAAGPRYALKGRVTDAASGDPLPYVTVQLLNTADGTVTDTAGFYRIEAEPGFYRVKISSLGFEPYLSPEVRVWSGDVRIDASLKESSIALGEVSVVASPFRRNSESPLALRVIGIQEIEKSPGGNRDISRIVNSYPGVASSVGGGYRNDLMVRGGGPSENRFFLDGVEIPNINHFATQGASGGPIGIINADFIREVDFYTGAFPVSRGNALSSVLNFRLQEGDSDRHRFKGTVGASEIAGAASGPIGKKTTYLVSVRQSYLQLLFSLLDMPFLPQFTDAQFKIRTRFSQRHELTVLGLGALDDMRLNRKTDPADKSKQYLLGYLPKIEQETYTVGAVYKHYAGNHIQTFVLSRSYLNNRNTKYRNNDASSPENLSLRYRSTESENRFRFENSSQLGDFRIQAGAGLEYACYTNHTRQKLFTSVPISSVYDTRLGLWKGSLFASADYTAPDNRFSASLGVRMDANDYSRKMANPLRQLSPRLSLSYWFIESMAVNASVGRFYQLPAYTTLGYKDEAGRFVNRENGITYLRSDQVVLGLEYKGAERARVTLEGFYKRYDQMPLSLADSIPLACKGTNYGATGNEAVASSARGRAYGAELMVRWIGSGRFNLVASYTFVRSEFHDPRRGGYLPSAWDNRHLLTVAGTCRLPRHWDVGLRFRAMGGTPYTPYDTDKSSLVEAWDARLQPYYDYSRYNRRRLSTFTQLDVRIDKSYYFKGVMLGFYVDLQNVLNTKYRNADVYVSTGQIDPADPQRYVMEYIRQDEGTILPTLGITVEF